MQYKREQEAKLILQDGSIFYGYSFGALCSEAGEVVFNTGMVGYPENITDPSYHGQILVLTYPLIGNYGVPKPIRCNGVIKNFESNSIKIKGLVVSNYSYHHSHYTSIKSLGEWLEEEGIPAITGIDTRALTKRLREKGTMLGKIIINDHDIDFIDPNRRNLVAEVSVKKPIIYGNNKKTTIVLVDCGVKSSIIHSLLSRNLRVIRVPWDYDFSHYNYDGVVVSNGPGNPKMARKTIRIVKSLMNGEKPIFGICLGNQILALAAGADTYKLKYGHRSQNQPCILIDEEKKRCYITSQNHGYAIKRESLSDDWRELFVNANDKTNEGIKHKDKPFFAVQFHPEASPGPTDTEFLFDEFLRLVNNERH